MDANFRNKCYIFICLIIFSSGLFAGEKKDLWTVDDLLQNKTRPFAIGHRGYGENTGDNPNKPVENTIESVQRAFEEGISIVEVDVVVTADNKAVVIHDDFFGSVEAGITCINTLTYDELKETLHYVPTLNKVLRTAKKFARKSSTISGLVNIEVKTPSPLCDPGDTTESMLVNAIIDAVNKTKMQQQVIIEAVSPALMNLFMVEAPELMRNYSANALQFMSPEMIENLPDLHLQVSLIDKTAGYGLQWAEVGTLLDIPPYYLPLFRLPGYYDLIAGQPDLDAFVYAAMATGSHLITFDGALFLQMELVSPGSAANLVANLQLLGLVVTAYTVNTQEEWDTYAAFGVDAIYTNDITLEPGE